MQTSFGEYMRVYTCAFVHTYTDLRKREITEYNKNSILYNTFTFSCYKYFLLSLYGIKFTLCPWGNKEIKEKKEKEIINKMFLIASFFITNYPQHQDIIWYVEILSKLWLNQ